MKNSKKKGLLKFIKKTMMILFSVLVVFVLGVLVFLHTERFGEHSSGERLGKIEKSYNHENGQFKNQQPTPTLTEGVGYWKVLSDFLFSSKPKEPNDSLPSLKTDLMGLNPEQNVLIWMGHSSYFIQLDGKKILVDPVLSGNASPLSFTTHAYKGSDIYTTDEIPELDYLFITHDHWDHMDYNTLKQLGAKVETIITGIGNGAHLERWGFSSEMILEGDWYQEFVFEGGFSVAITPSRHFSGRGIKRNQTLWASFVLKSPSSTVYFGGDSGYGSHFKDIGDKYGPFDLAVLENGQYNENWKYIHMLPGEQFKAAKDLQARTIFPVHSGKFTLASHDWDEPFKLITELSDTSQQRVITPKIGELVDLNDSLREFGHWWEEVDVIKKD